MVYPSGSQQLILFWLAFLSLLRAWSAPPWVGAGELTSTTVP